MDADASAASRAVGFWDEAHYYDVALAPLFTTTLLATDGREITYRLQERRWQPDRLVQHYRTDAELALTEEKALVGGDVLASQLHLENRSEMPQTVHLIVWTMQESLPSKDACVKRVARRHKQVSFMRQSRETNLSANKIACTFGMDRTATSSSLILSESGPLQPSWTYTPFYEGFVDGKLDDLTALGGSDGDSDSPLDGMVYGALHVRLDLPPGASQVVTSGFCAAPSSSAAAEQLSDALQQPDTVQISTTGWRQYFEDLPSFSCSDPHLEAYYWYRWYGLRLFEARPDTGNYRHPAVYEGPAYFRKLITYSAQCHMRELRWLSDPAGAQGSLLNFVENQASDGRFYGHLFAEGAQEESFYHADWSPFWSIYLQHQDEAFLKRAYDGLQKYLAYFDRERDSEASGLYDIWNHYETGQEYMHRYVAVSEKADKINWGRNFRLKGVDVAVQIYQTKRAMARAARMLGRKDEAARWDAEADDTRAAVRREMWDPDVEMFFDVDPETGERTCVKATTCFYPYFTDIVTADHLPGLKHHLFNPEEFWTPYPAPSSSRDDAYFSARPHWKDMRMNCPWNGRVWPMTNSHVAEALGQAARRFDDDGLRMRAAEFMQRYVRMMFDEGDAGRPNCFEHYNPLTGQPSRYRGIDDYQHSWVVDLILTYVCGLRIHESSVTIDPLPFDLEDFHLRRVPVRGRLVDVAREGDRFRASVDGTPAGESTLGTPLQLTL